MGCGASLPATGPTADSASDRKKRIQQCQDSINQNGGRLFVYGVLQRANVRNRNGRVYPKAILQREAERFYDSHVKPNFALGELDHPNPHSETFRSLTLENVSHRVLDFSWEGDDLAGYVEVLPTPAGAMLKDLYLAGCRLGMSSRGWATLKEKDGCVYIQDDFELITFDFVSDPSTEGAYLLPVQEKIDAPQPIPFHLYSNYYKSLAAPPPPRNGGTCAPAISTNNLPLQVACEGTPSGSTLTNDQNVDTNRQTPPGSLNEESAGVSSYRNQQGQPVEITKRVTDPIITSTPTPSSSTPNSHPTITTSSIAGSSSLKNAERDKQGPSGSHRTSLKAQSASHNGGGVVLDKSVPSPSSLR
mmetsp:Transcript_1518/g.1727  ORF Transcript_1518/g.1727 Transcript_1518/m.1727 type:complete len:360 (-) Transcript_1518:514-1593(-)|eukprot:CAMPEP_0197855368 /NCGR_PEP_ID=MMETSP1438-20131217/26507_1 /TAXON_ID=1461541 /ORGANISM="Pterosperma sp., Strain CCMP1384" /LENGTH=359 /DNA_ID=CAMNT_0043470451 /DNA_START=551 /DNA_END=1630 /DNA_ORIENTATION=-